MNRKLLAETIEGYDGEIAALQKSKRETYDDYRHDLAKAGHDKDAVKAEIEAFKLALRRKLAVKKSSDEAVTAQGELVDEIFAEITAARAPRATRVREDEPEHDAETGEVIETARELVARGVEAADHGIVATSGAAAPLATNPGAEDVAPPPAHAPEQPGTDHGSVNTPEGGGAQPSNITPLHRLNPKTHFANSKGLPRLHGCMKPEACGGSHRALCFTCQRSSEGSAA